MLLFYVRHGHPTYDPDELTPLGKRQAESVAHRLCDFGVDRIFASSSNRAQETAQPTSEICGVPIETLDFANEKYAWQDFSVETEKGKGWICYEGEWKARMLSSECLALGDRWHEHPWFASTRVSQGIRRIDEETDALMESLGYRHDRNARGFIPVAPSDDHVALFAHLGFGMAFLSSLLDIPYPYLSVHIDMHHTGVTVIDFPTPTEENSLIRPRILQLSCDSHLWRDGLPTTRRAKKIFSRI